MSRLFQSFFSCCGLQVGAALWYDSCKGSSMVQFLQFVCGMIVAGKRKKIPVAGEEVTQHLPIYLLFNSAALSHPIFFDTYHLFLAVFRTFFIFFFSFSVLASHIVELSLSDNIHNRDNQQSYNDQQYNTYNHSFFWCCTCLI